MVKVCSRWCSMIIDGGMAPPLPVVSAKPPKESKNEAAITRWLSVGAKDCGGTLRTPDVPLGAVGDAADRG
ncbi:hypothetical protein NL676_034804 [Syzygium grande]|nr:hypothetical protein NL676_034804 [Syzygium grande]